MQDPERYMKAASVRPPGLFPRGRKGVLDSSLRKRINYEIYYFANRGEMGRFRKDPIRYCGLLTDPVTLVRFRPSPTSPREEFAGRPYYFAADSSRVRFRQNPLLYQDRRTGTR